ncbi:MAG: hypothetical protein II458_05485 [Oscillospiraceae bacterium]|nr:hypothetical protein [Oscillospiraceae bacterium]
MRVIKNILSQLHIYVIWLILATLLWSWIFLFVTDTVRTKKVMVFIDAACQDVELRMELEKDMPKGLRMIQVRPFSYFLFDDENLLRADIYIVPASKVEAYRDSFTPLNGGELPGYTVSSEGGIRIYDAAAGSGAAKEFITYTVPGEEGEDYYLFFGAQSVHSAFANETGDDAALAVAEALLHLH